MDKKRKINIPYNLLMTIVHLIGFVIFIIGVINLYINDNLNKGLSWIDNEVYEDSPAFSAQLEDDIELIFDYIMYKDIFETEGVFDVKKEMFSINLSPGNDVSYTVEDVVSYAKQLGYYIDKDYNFNIYDDAELFADGENSVLVNSRAYAKDVEINEPGDAYMTMSNLVEESLEVLSKYYKAYNRLTVGPSNIKYRVIYNSKKYTNDESLSLSSAKDFGKYIISSQDDMLVDHNLTNAPSNLSYVASSIITDDDDYSAIIVIDTTYPVEDLYSLARSSYEQQRNMYFNAVVFISCGLVLMLLSVLIFIISKRKHRETDRIILYSKETWGIEVNILVFLLEIIMVLFICEFLGDKLLRFFVKEDRLAFFEILSRYILIYLCAIHSFLAIIRGMQLGILYNKSFMGLIKKQYILYVHKTENTKKATLFFAMYFIINVFTFSAIVIIYHTENTLTDRFILMFLMLFIIIYNLISFHMVYRKFLEFNKLEYAVESMAKGNLQYKLDIEDFSGKEVRVAENLNSISLGLESAISNQVKSERLKADLITNVSHDIKTPLTSIINYVDLIKREKFDNTKIKGYVDILEKKATHLKNLTEDLLEASKVSSGNMPISMSKIDFVEIILQMNGEFEEKYAERNLEIVADLPKESIIVDADSRHLWRILDNVYSNAYKYAKKDSRVYVSISIEDDTAVFVMKNMSENALNINADELLERFVRGDISRSTEGSGLGLSIAKSLAELQNSIFDIQIDGDLFKIILKLSISEYPELGVAGVKE